MFLFKSTKLSRLNPSHIVSILFLLSSTSVVDIPVLFGIAKVEIIFVLANFL